MPGARTPNRCCVPGILAMAVLALAVPGCTGERPELAAEPEPTTTPTPAGDETTTSQVERTVEVAQASGDAIDVFADEDTGAPAQRLTAATITSAPGIPVVFLVKDRGDERVEVYLPVEPAGSTGWVRATDVTLRKVSHRVEVDVSGHRLRVYDEQDVVLDEPAGIGPDRPQPTDGLYLKELVQPPEDGGAYGTYAYGLSGAPMVRAGLEVGEGVVGIHGTDDDALIGTDMPVGSVAVTAAVLSRLVDELGLPLGTPVEIRP